MSWKNTVKKGLKIGFNTAKSTLGASKGFIGSMINKDNKEDNSSLLSETLNEAFKFPLGVFGIVIILTIIITWNMVTSVAGSVFQHMDTQMYNEEITPRNEDRENLQNYENGYDREEMDDFNSTSPTYNGTYVYIEGEEFIDEE